MNDHSSMSKHTHSKGQWKIAPDYYGHYVLSIKHDLWKAHEVYSTNAAEAKANARLMAAAPTLLRVLEMINERGVMLSDEITNIILSAIKQAVRS